MIVQPYTPPTDEYRKLRFAWSDSDNTKSQYTPIFQMSEITPSTGNNVTLSVTNDTSSELLGTNINNMTDANVRVLTVGEMIRNEDAINNASDSIDTSLHAALAKPMRRVGGVLSAGDTSSTFPTYDLFDPLFTTTYWINKLKGIYAIRATAVITLQVNASRFQAGRYILAYIPAAGLPYDSKQTQMIYWKQCDLCTVTQLPHVEIDVGTETEVTLRVPFTSFMSALPCPTVTNSTVTVGSPGYFFMRPYVPMVAGSGISTADYSIWVHYEDVVTKTAITSQMGTITEEEQNQSGPITSSIRTLQRQIGYASVGLDSIVSNTNWFLDACAGVATFLGFSKPINLNKIDQRTLTMHNSFSTFDGLDNSVPLSSCQRNEIEPNPGYGGSNIDPLTIDYIKSIPCYESQFVWSSTGASSVVGTALTKIPVNPGNNFNMYTAGASYNYFTYGPMAYLSKLYSYYRGSITYKFKFVKNEFYSGRLMVAFAPYDLDATAPPDPVFGVGTHLLNKTIIDVRLCKEFEISVPYAALTPFLSTGESYNTTNSNDPGIPYANVYVWVLNPLLAPTSVNPSITVVVESRGNKDLEFAFPKQHTMSVYANATIQMGKIEFQSGEMTTGILDVSIPGVDQKPLSLTDSARCFGEVQLSLRQLLKRPGFYRFTTNSQLLYTLYPFYSTVTTPSATTITNAGSIDMFSHLSAMFAFQRGGVNIKFIPASNTASPQYVNTSLRSMGNSTPLTNSFTATGTYPSTMYKVNNNGNSVVTRLDWGHSVRVPYYQNTPSIPAAGLWTDGVGTEYLGQKGRSSTQIQFYYGVGYTGSTNLNIVRYGADDCDFAQWTGIPPIYHVLPTQNIT